jgi:hypothetical protein
MVKRAIKETKSGKASGMDNICPEIIKLNIETSVNLLHPLLNEIWKEGHIIKIQKGDIKMQQLERNNVVEYSK